MLTNATGHEIYKGLLLRYDLECPGCTKRTKQYPWSVDNFKGFAKIRCEHCGVLYWVDYKHKPKEKK